MYFLWSISIKWSPESEDKQKKIKERNKNSLVPIALEENNNWRLFEIMGQFWIYDKEIDGEPTTVILEIFMLFSLSRLKRYVTCYTHRKPVLKRVRK